MAPFDIRTIIYSYLITNLICLVAMTLLWFRNRTRLAGLNFWVAAFAMQCLATLLLVFSGRIPESLSIVVSNTVSIGGAILLYMGLERFVSKKTSQAHNYLLLAVFILLQFYFAFIHPSDLMRGIILSVGIMLIGAQSAWLTLYRTDAEMRQVTRGLGYVFLAFILASAARIIANLVIEPEIGLFQSRMHEVIAVLINQMLLLILAFSLLLMVNRHFVMDLEGNTARREQVGEELAYSNNILMALQQTMFDILNRHNLDDILKTLLLKISTLLDVPDVSIHLIEERDTLLVYAATPGQPLQTGDLVRNGTGGWLSWQAIETRKPAILDDYATWAHLSAIYEDFPIHAVASIPIHHRNRVIGTINFSRRVADKPFSDIDIYVAGQLAQMIALVLDNTQLYALLESELAERKQIEESLRESQENFQSYFNMNAVGMCVIAADGHWIEANGRLRQMLGYTAEELDALTWNELTHPEDLEADLVMQRQILANERDSYHLDKRFIRKDGSVLYATFFVTCHRNPDGTVRYILASVVDITDRKQGEESSLKLAAIEERQRLARDLHDSVNQSIHGLVLFSETLVTTLGRNNVERAKQIADRLQESARQALKEARLMLYEMQSPGHARNVDLIHDLETRLGMVERRAGVKAQIIQEGSRDHCPRAWDENLFWIAIEALNNALKHAQAHNMKIMIRSTPRHMELEIIDDGIGFDPDRPRLGGMGLQNLRERASLLGGELRIISEPNKGTRVQFRAEIEEQNA